MIQITKWSNTPAKGAPITTTIHMRMPDEERSGLYDPEEEYAWDHDNVYPLDGGDDDDDEEGE